MAIIKYENGDLNSLGETGYKIVDFYADWCGPCKMMATVLEDYSIKNPNVTIVKVDVDKHQAIAGEYGVMSIPTIYIYKDNKEISKFIGFRDEEDLDKIINP